MEKFLKPFSEFFHDIGWLQVIMAIAIIGIIVKLIIEASKPDSTEKEAKEDGDKKKGDKDKDAAKKRKAWWRNFIKCLISAILFGVAAYLVYTHWYAPAESETRRFFLRPLPIVLGLASLFFISEMFGFTKATPSLRTAFAVAIASVFLVTLFADGMLGYQAAATEIDKLPQYSKTQKEKLKIAKLRVKVAKPGNGGIRKPDGSYDYDKLTDKTLYWDQAEELEYGPNDDIFVASVEKGVIPSEWVVVVDGKPLTILEGGGGELKQLKGKPHKVQYFLSATAILNGTCQRH